MPRDGSNIYHQPFPDVASGTTIASAVYNGYTADVTQDLNAPRPIVAGGTGATSAAGALTALGGETNYQQVTNYDSYAFKGGSFYSDTAATAGPVAGRWFYGTAITGGGGGSVTLEARDIFATPPLKYTRFFNGTAWGAWQLSTAADGAVAKAGDTMSGDLTITKAGPTVFLNKTAVAQFPQVMGQLNGAARWSMTFGDTGAESGSNAGSNFALYRYTDAGAFNAAAMDINRASGLATFYNMVNINGTNLCVGAGGGTGNLLFGNTGTRFLQYDGTRYNFVNANVVVNSGECVVNQAGNAFRARANDYGTILHNNGGFSYFLLTNNGDPDGAFNSLRPFTITNSNGTVGFGHVVNVTGQLNASSDIVGRASVYSGYNNASSGTYYFGNNATKYLTCDGTNFVFSPNSSVTVSGDLITFRTSAPTTGYHFFGNTGSKYLQYDGTNYYMNGGNLFLVPPAGNVSTFFCNSAGTALSGVGTSSTSVNVYSNAAGSTGQFIALGTNTWSSISDARLPYKKTARPLTALDRLEHVQLYENEVDGRLELFAKAQEFDRAFPHLVRRGSGGDDYVPTGISDDKAWSMSYDRTGIVALQAIKELLAQVEHLQARVAQLEAR